MGRPIVRRGPTGLPARPARQYAEAESCAEVARDCTAAPATTRRCADRADAGVLRAARGDDRPIVGDRRPDLPDGWRLPSWVEASRPGCSASARQGGRRNAHADRHGDVVARIIARPRWPARSRRRSRSAPSSSGLRPRAMWVGGWAIGTPRPGRRRGLPRRPGRARCRGCRSPARRQLTAKRHRADPGVDPTGRAGAPRGRRQARLDASRDLLRAMRVPTASALASRCSRARRLDDDQGPSIADPPRSTARSCSPTSSRSTPLNVALGDDRTSPCSRSTTRSSATSSHRGRRRVPQHRRRYGIWFTNADDAVWSATRCTVASRVSTSAAAPIEVRIGIATDGRSASTVTVRHRRGAGVAPVRAGGAGETAIDAATAGALSRAQAPRSARRPQGVCRARACLRASRP